AAGCKALTDAVDTLARTYGVILIDTPGHESYLMRLAHSLADTLITPVNDSFVDLDVLGTVDPRTFEVTGTSHYSQMVQAARRKRHLDRHLPIGLSCGIDSRRSVRATSVWSAGDCNSFRDGSIFAALKDWRSA
ncbi:MAG TPA: division plane positioning ATPase MipZ, partial [Tepidisphaeraceae bacterium]|nr:division plane positioning ATPase MipZ [Tepidisphaeraceae bacterium]